MSTILAILLAAFPGKVDPIVVERLAQESHLTTDDFRALAKSCDANRSQALATLSSMIQQARSDGTRKSIVAEVVQYRKDILGRVSFAFADLPKDLPTNSVGALPGATAKVLQVVDATTVRVELTFFAGTRPYNPPASLSSAKDMQAMQMAMQFPEAVYTHQDVIIRNFSTANLIDGTIESDVMIRSFQPFRCVGPFQYATAAGAARTVPLLEPFDQTSLATYAQLVRGKSVAKSQRSKKPTKVVAKDTVEESASKPQEPEPTKPHQPEAMTPENVTLPSKQSRYLNATYGATIRFVGNGKWQGANNATGKDDNGYYKEISRTKDYVEILQINGNIPTRLCADHIEQKLNGKWQRVADGRWDSH